MSALRRFSLALMLALLFSGMALAQSLPDEDSGIYVTSPDNHYMVKVRQHAGRSLVSLIDAGQMAEVSHWELQNFQAQDIQFTANPPQRLMLSSPEKIVVYEIIGEKEKLLYTQPAGAGKKIDHAAFSENEKEILWTTKDALVASDLEKQKPQKLKKLDQPASDVAPLKDNLIAVSQDNKEELQLVPRHNPTQAKPLKGHEGKVVGTVTPDGEALYSLDEKDELVRWDLLKKEPATRQQLLPGKDLKPIALGLDDSKQNLLVLYQDKQGKRVGKRIPIESVERLSAKAEDVPLTQMPNGRLHISFQGLFNESGSSIAPRMLIEQGQSFLPLAEIEAENGNYTQALQYIDLVSPNSPDYRASRSLQRKIYDEMALNQELQAAEEQFRQGNYESAQILLQGLGAKYPKDDKVNRLLNTTNEKINSSRLLNWLTFALVLILLGLLGYLVYVKKPEALLAPFKEFAKEQIQNREIKAQQALKQRFAQKLNQTKAKLAEGLNYDVKKQAAFHWKKISDQLGRVEKSARSTEPPYEQLIQILENLQAEIASTLANLRRTTQNGQVKSSTEPKGQTPEPEAPKQDSQKRTEEQRKAQAQKEEAESKRRAEEQRKAQQPKEEAQQKSQQQQSKPQDPPRNEPDNKDYYAILGISPNATPEDIKKAYRQKVKEYHPDRHNSSDFEWVKEEASRMIRLIGEAYEVLNDPKRRAEFDRKKRG